MNKLNIITIVFIVFLLMTNLVLWLRIDEMENRDDALINQTKDTMKMLEECRQDPLGLWEE